MKLDTECIRALLLVLEEALAFGDDLEYPEVLLSKIREDNRLKEFTLDTLAYCSLKLKEAKYIEAQIFDADDTFCDATFTSITYSGHEYLESVRDSENWKKVKSLSGKVGNASLSILKSISEGVATAALNKLLKISE